MDTPMAAAESSISDDDGIDRISHLPNSLLHHILSFVPTQTSIRTTPLISRRFRNLWKNLEAFDFCDRSSYQIHDHDNDEQFLIFAVFVNTVLVLRRSRVIRKFRLSCYHDQHDPFYNYYIDTWISSAIGPNLEEFHLTLLTAGFSNLPLALFSCSNLVSLIFNGYILLQLHDSSKICLPSLKILQLLDMYHLDLNSVNILLSACPVLENLELSFNPESLARLRVSSSTLKRLKIYVENRVGACLEIDAPDLNYLYLSNITFRDAAAIGNLQTVEEAYLDVFSTPESESVEPILSLLRALSGIKHLELISSTTKWLFAAPILDFLEFRHLLYLELWFLSVNASFLIDMLQKCPVLQTLITFNHKMHPSYDSSPSYGWEVKPKSVPKCLVSHLTFIDLRGYLGNLNELEFTSYVLQNGLVLKTMLIGDFWLKQRGEWLKKISDLPRACTMCQVKFH